MQLHTVLIAVLALLVPIGECVDQRVDQLVEQRAPGIAWEKSYDAATQRARDEQRVLVVAAHLVGEPATERMLDKVYTEGRIVELLQRTVNLGTSNAYLVDRPDFLEHFGSPTVAEARAIDVAVRERVLAPDPDGYVIAPQHVFLGPDGAVLLSVPYEIDEHELEWCLVEAILLVDPDAGVRRSTKARAPRRLIVGGVSGGTNGAPPPASPPDAAELKELLGRIDDDELDAGQRVTILMRLMTSDDKRAVKVVARHLESAPLQSKDSGLVKRNLLRGIGELSPPTYYDMVANYLDHDEVGLRNEAAVALEQLGAAKAEAVVIKRLGREDDPRVRKNLARALGASGYDSGKARRELERTAERDKDGLVRVNALLAMGRLTPSDETRAFLCQAASAGDDRARAAALVAMAWSRDPYWRGVLPRVERGEAVTADVAAPLDAASIAALASSVSTRESRANAAAKVALEVLGGGALDLLAPFVSEIGGDKLPRHRLFAGSGGEGD